VTELSEIQKRLITRRIKYLQMKSAQRMRQKEEGPRPPWWTTAIRDDEVYFLGYRISTNGQYPSSAVHIGEVIKDLFAHVEKRKTGASFRAV